MYVIAQELSTRVQNSETSQPFRSSHEEITNSISKFFSTFKSELKKNAQSEMKKKGF